MILSYRVKRVGNLKQLNLFSGDGRGRFRLRLLLFNTVQYIPVQYTRTYYRYIIIFVNCQNFKLLTNSEDQTSDITYKYVLLKENPFSSCTFVKLKAGAGVGAAKRGFATMELSFASNDSKVDTTISISAVF